MNGTEPLRVNCRKGSVLIMGNDCLLSLGVVIDTSSQESEENVDSEPQSRNILIGQHVWIGQKAAIKGGSSIRSGAVIGAETTIKGQTIPAGTCWANRKGQLQKIHDHIVFLRKSIRNTPRNDIWTNDTIDDDHMGEILKLTKNHWKWVMAMIETEPSAEKRLSLLADSAGRRGFKRPAYQKSPPKEVSDNQIIGNYKNIESKVSFLGSDNVLILEEGVTLEHTQITFNGDNSIVYLSKSDFPYRLRISMHTDTTLYIGRNNQFAQGKAAAFSVAEAQSVLVGNDCHFGQRVWLRTSDQHPLYDQKTRKRLNPPKSVLIGDSSDLVDDSLVMKGQKIGIRNGFLLKDRYERTLRKLQQTIDKKERMRILQKLGKGRAKSQGIL